MWCGMKLPQIRLLSVELECVRNITKIYRSFHTPMYKLNRSSLLLVMKIKIEMYFRYANYDLFP